MVLIYTFAHRYTLLAPYYTLFLFTIHFCCLLYTFSAQVMGSVGVNEAVLEDD